jgi:hypothetical protein
MVDHQSHKPKKRKKIKMTSMYENYLAHHGVKGQKWGVRRHKTIADRWRMHQMKKIEKRNRNAARDIDKIEDKTVRRGKRMSGKQLARVTNNKMIIETPKKYADAYNKLTNRVKATNPELLNRRGRKEYKRSAKAVARYNKLLDKRKETLAKYGLTDNQHYQALAERTAGMKTANKKRYRRTVNSGYLE